MCHLTSSSTKKTTSNSFHAFVAFDFQWFNSQFISSSILLQTFVMLLYLFVSKNRRSLKHSSPTLEGWTPDLWGRNSCRSFKNGSYHTFPLPQKWIFPHSCDYSPVTLTLSNFPLVVVVVEGGLISPSFSQSFCDIESWKWGYCFDWCAMSWLRITTGTVVKKGLLIDHVRFKLSGWITDSSLVSYHSSSSSHSFNKVLLLLAFYSSVCFLTTWTNCLALQQLKYFPNKYLLKYNYKPENKEGTSLSASWDCSGIWLRRTKWLDQLNTPQPDPG